MCDEGEEGWVSPTPVSTAVVEAVTGATALDADDLDDLDSYVDRSDLRDVVSSGDGSLTFAVEGHDVTVSADGSIRVDA